MPASMTVIVNTVIAGEVELTLQPHHPVKDRYDIVFAKDGMVGVIPGTPAYSPVRPVLPDGARKIAEILVAHTTPCIYDM